MARIKYEVVSTYTGVKHPFARTAKFTNAKVAIAHAKRNGNTAVVLDLSKNRQAIFQRALTYANH